MLDNWDEPGITDVVFKMGTRLGKTIVFGMIAAHLAGHVGLDIGYYKATEELMKAFSKDYLEKPFEQSPILASLWPDTSNVGEGVLKIGAVIRLFNIAGKGSVRHHSFSVALADEISKWESLPDGGPGKLMRNRTTNGAKRFHGFCSTPGEKRFCRISPMNREGDQRQWFVPCPHCQHEHLFSIDHTKPDQGFC